MGSAAAIVLVADARGARGPDAEGDVLGRFASVCDSWSSGCSTPRRLPGRLMESGTPGMSDLGSLRSMVGSQEKEAQVGVTYGRTATMSIWALGEALIAERYTCSYRPRYTQATDTHMSSAPSSAVSACTVSSRLRSR